MSLNLLHLPEEFRAGWIYLQMGKEMNSFLRPSSTTLHVLRQRDSRTTKELAELKLSSLLGRCKVSVCGLVQCYTQWFQRIGPDTGYDFCQLPHGTVSHWVQAAPSREREYTQYNPLLYGKLFCLASRVCTQRYTLPICELYEDRYLTIESAPMALADELPSLSYIYG